MPNGKLSKIVCKTMRLLRHPPETLVLKNLVADEAANSLAIRRFNQPQGATIQHSNEAYNALFRAGEFKGIVTVNRTTVLKMQIDK